MASVYDWSTTAADNANSDSGINFAEGQAPSTVNNSGRQVMGRVAEFISDLGGTQTFGGTADALTITAASGFTSLANGLIIGGVAAADNTGAITINANGLGAKAGRKMGSSGDAALEAGDIQQDGFFLFRYNSALNASAGGWQILNPVTDISALQPLDATLTALAGVTFAADKGLYATGADAFATYDLTAYGRSLGGVADEAAFKALVNLEAGTDFNPYQANQAESAWQAGTSTTASRVSPAHVLSAIRALSFIPTWVNFDGYTGGTTTINDSYNVTSVNRNGTGDYTINFTSALSSANYAVFGTTTGLAAENVAANVIIHGSTTGGATTKTTSALRIEVGNSSSGLPFDAKDISVLIVGSP